eukprot:GDKK01031246.1.p1 GENE.GDKK01031246.1~~GDKK01031246.1.p1  ORF type:complete len:433 (+),score=129.78 GDKK01031246.1:66-1364(+)
MASYITPFSIETTAAYSHFLASIQSDGYAIFELILDDACDVGDLLKMKEASMTIDGVAVANFTNGAGDFPLTDLEPFTFGSETDIGIYIQAFKDETLTDIVRAGAIDGSITFACYTGSDISLTNAKEFDVTFSATLPKGISTTAADRLTYDFVPIDDAGDSITILADTEGKVFVPVFTTDPCSGDSVDITVTVNGISATVNQPSRSVLDSYGNIPTYLPVDVDLTSPGIKTFTMEVTPASGVTCTIADTFKYETVTGIFQTPDLAFPASGYLATSTATLNAVDDAVSPADNGLIYAYLSKSANKLYVLHEITPAAAAGSATPPVTTWTLEVDGVAQSTSVAGHQLGDLDILVHEIDMDALTTSTSIAVRSVVTRDDTFSSTFDSTIEFAERYNLPSNDNNNGDSNDDSSSVNNAVLASVAALPLLACAAARF